MIDEMNIDIIFLHKIMFSDDASFQLKDKVDYTV